MVNFLTNKRGSAYVMVLIATMAMLMIIALVLTITASSRDTTARYIKLASQYDLAVSGNEQALFLLNRAFENNRQEILDSVTSHENLTQQATPFFTQSLLQYFANSNFGYRREWHFSILIEELYLHDSYQAITTVIPAEPLSENIFTVTTVVTKNYIPVTVMAGITWQHPSCNCENSPNLRFCLDDYSLAMVELLRVAD